jgi:hypothetical protein
VWKKLKKMLKERKRKLHPIRVFFSNFCAIKNLSHFSKNRRRTNTRICTTNKKVCKELEIFGVQKQQNCLKKERKNTGLDSFGGRFEINGPV